jgi:hypothetical protein
MDANFAKQAEPGAGKVKEMCPQCLLMQRLSSPCHCTAVQPGKAATLLRHGNLLHRSKFQYFQSEYFPFYWNPITVNNDSIIRKARGRFPELAYVHAYDFLVYASCPCHPVHPARSVPQNPMGDCSHGSARLQEIFEDRVLKVF